MHRPRPHWRRLSACLLLCLCAATAAAAPRGTLRCGWFENPTPGNAWLNDRDGTWTIGVQGGHQAKGDWPDFPDARWLRTNGSYGYGCACLRVVAARGSQDVSRILSARSLPLQRCRSDARLKEPLSPDEH